MANVCCPIELEPKTLKEHQISEARDVAVEIVLKKEANEATSLFIQGMHPVGDVKEITGRDEQVEELLNKDKHADQTTPIGTSCQCSCPSAQRESPTYQSNKLKEPVSAHF